MTASGDDDVDLHRYVDLLGAEDVDGALTIARALLDGGRRLDEVIVDLLCAGQVEVGRRWERNEWTVTQEHIATAVSETVLEALISDADVSVPPVDGGRLVAVCAEGEWHTLAIRVVGEVVRHAGWDVMFLDPAVHAPELARRLHDVGPDGLLVSCSISLNLGGARRLIEASRATGTPVLAGGRGFGPDGRWAATLGANAWADGPLDALVALSTWEPYTTPAPPLSHPGFTEHLRLEASREHLASTALAATALSALPDPGTSDAHGTDPTVRELLVQLTRAASAASLVDDGAVIAAFTDWLDHAATPRGLPAATIDAAIDALADAVEGNQLPAAAAMLRHELVRRTTR